MLCSWCIRVERHFWTLAPFGQTQSQPLHQHPSFTFVFIILLSVVYCWLTYGPIPNLSVSVIAPMYTLQQRWAISRPPPPSHAFMDGQGASRPEQYHKHHCAACLWSNKLWWKCCWQKLFNTISMLTALLKPRPSGQRYDSLANKPVKITANKKI